MIKKLCDRVCPIACKLSWIPPLVIRIAMGGLFLNSGINKFRDMHTIVEFFASLGIPAPAIQAPFVASVEVLGGMCLLLGIGTRLAAIPLSGTMVVALLTAKREDAFKDLSSLIDTSEFLYLLLLLALMGLGSGCFSLDYWFCKKKNGPETC